MEEQKTDVIAGDNQTDTTGSTDKQPNPQGTGADAGKTDVGTTGAAATDKPEFEDKDMQARFTQRMQELSEKEKAWETEKADLAKAKAILDRLNNDPEVVSFVAKRYGAKTEEKPQSAKDVIAQADVDNIITEDGKFDKDKFASLVEKVADVKYGNIQGEVKQTRAELRTMALENDIDFYSKQKGNEDFWELQEQGLINPIMREIRIKNPQSNDMAVITEAHRTARNIVQAIHKKAEASATAKANGMLEQKKNASVDKGTGAEASALKGKSMIEIGKMVAKELGIPD